MAINILGAQIDRQFINGDPKHWEWRVSYQWNGRGQYFQTVSNRDAWDSQLAVEVAKRELGQTD
jgi:hypothetical protein